MVDRIQFAKNNFNASRVVLDIMNSFERSTIFKYCSDWGSTSIPDVKLGAGYISSVYNTCPNCTRNEKECRNSWKSNTLKNHPSNTASQQRRRKMNLFRKFYTSKNYMLPRPAIDFDFKTQYLGKEDDVLYLIAAKRESNCHGRFQPLFV